MISKEDLLLTVGRGKPLSSDITETINAAYSVAREIAEEVEPKIPSIGFLSRKRRISAFMYTCEVINEYVKNKKITLGDSQLVLVILRLSNSKFNKAISMFDILAHRTTLYDRATMPLVAREYLAGIEYCGH